MSLTQDIKDAFSTCSSLEEQVALLNELRETLAEVSPFSEPVDCVRWVLAENIHANAYNPNKVFSPELKLLHESIKSDGYTQPIVAYPLGNGEYEIVDGYHRNRVGREFEDIREKVHGYLPVVVIHKELDERIGSTIRHNRARGVHQIRSMSDIVVDLVKAGWEDSKICEKLGMGLDEVLRLKQISGLKEAFLGHTFSQSWEEFERVNYPDEIGVATKTISNAPVRRARS